MENLFQGLYKFQTACTVTLRKLELLASSAIPNLFSTTTKRLKKIKEKGGKK